MEKLDDDIHTLMNALAVINYYVATDLIPSEKISVALAAIGRIERKMFNSTNAFEALKEKLDSIKKGERQEHPYEIIKIEDDILGYLIERTRGEKS